MADTTRNAQVVRQTYTFGDRRFIGVNTNVNPNSLEDGFVQVADNVWNDGGALVTRPGFHAQITTPVSPIHAMLQYRQSNNTASKILVVSEYDASPAMSIGYYSDGDTAITPLGVVNGNASDCRLVQHGKYIYGVPGPDGGSLWKYDGSTVTQVGMPRAPKIDGKNPIQPVASPKTRPIKTIAGAADIDNDSAATTFGAAFSSTAASYEMITATAVSEGYTFELDTDGSVPSTGTWQNSGAGLATVKQYTNIDAALNGAEKISNYASQSGNKALLLDGGGDWIKKQITVPTYTYDGSTKTIAMFSFRSLMYNNDALDSRRNHGVFVTITGLDSSSNPIPGCVFTQIVQPTVAQSVTDWKEISLFADFRAFQTTLSKVELKLQTANSAQSTTGDSRGVLVDNVALHPVLSNLAPNSAVTDASGLVQIRTRQQCPTLSPLRAGYVKGISVRISSLSTTDLSNKDTVSLQMDFPEAYRDNPPYMSLGIKNTGSSTISWSGYGTYEPTYKYMQWNVFGIAQASRNNVSQVYVRLEQDFDTTHDTVLMSIGDLVADGGLTANTTYEYVFTKWSSDELVALRPPYYVEDGVYAQGNESLPSAASKSVTTTAAYSSIELTLNPADALNSNMDLRYDTTAINEVTPAGTKFTNTVPAFNQKRVTSGTTGSVVYVDDTGTTRTVAVTANVPSTLTYPIVSVTSAPFPIWVTHTCAFALNAEYEYYCIYRRGQGVFPDGRFRLIAVIPYDATPYALGKNWRADYTSVTVGSAFKRIVFTDRVPDSDILYEAGPYEPGFPFETGRDQLPTGCTAIASHAKRLFVAKDNTVYGSWMLDNVNEAPVYTTLVPDTSDPNIYVKGTSFTVSSREDNEKITALLSYGGDGMFINNTTSASLLVLRENSVLPVLGFDPTNFTIQSMLREPSVGCISPGGAISFFGRLMWMSPTGVLEFANGMPANRSIELRRLLSMNASFNGADIDSSLYKHIQFFVHDMRLFVFAPTTWSFDNEVAYVYDMRTSGWTRWLAPAYLSGSVGFNSAAALTGGDDTSVMYIGTQTGQIYKITGTADRLTPSTAVTPIEWSVKTRQYGQTYSEGIAYYNLNRVNQVDVHYESRIKQLKFSQPSTGTDFFCNQDLQAGDVVQIPESTGILTPGTNYYVISAGLTKNKFRLATTPGGTAIPNPGYANTGLLTYSVDHSISYAVGNVQGSNVFNPAATAGTYTISSGINKTIALRNVLRDTLSQCVEITISGSCRTPGALYATHIHASDSRIPRL
jgi:hypothetical protein